MTTQNSKPWSVNLYESHPDMGNDDCTTGADYANENEAREVFKRPWPEFARSARPHAIEYVELALNGRRVALRKNPKHNPRRVAREAEASDREWRREIAMQAGMAFGVEAFNEEMGW